METEDTRMRRSLEVAGYDEVFINGYMTALNSQPGPRSPVSKQDPYARGYDGTGRFEVRMFGTNALVAVGDRSFCDYKLAMLVHAGYRGFIVPAPQ